MTQVDAPPELVWTDEPPRSFSELLRVGPLLCASVVLNVAALGFLFLGHDKVRIGVERAHPSWSATQLSSEEFAHSAGTIVFSILMIVGWLWLADKITLLTTTRRIAAVGFAAVAALGSTRIGLEGSFPWGAKVAYGLAGVAALAITIQLARRREPQQQWSGARKRAGG